MKRALCFVLYWAALHASLRVSAAATDGDAVIRAPAGPSEIVLKTGGTFAGAIYSLTWNGREFINARDHGRLLQSAVNLDDGTPITGETFNPTEAGSRDDHFSTHTTSRLLALRAHTNDLQTLCRMAFWLAPGENSFSSGKTAKNTNALSRFLLRKHVVIGYQRLPQVITYDITLTIPAGEHHTHADFEALTGYMPPEFSEVLALNPQTGELKSQTNAHSFLSKPLICSVPERSHAMGIFAPPQPQPHTEGPSYGYYRFFHPKKAGDEKWKTMKWNCVFRLNDPQGISPGEYSYRMFVIVGDCATVQASMRKLVAMSAAEPPSRP